MMLQSCKNWYWQLMLGTFLTISGAIVIISEGDYALAQNNIVPDSTLGAESSTVAPLASGSSIDEIRGGAIRGTNLFHSFLEFNVGEGQGAYFYSPNANIQNIIARVTGSNRSDILGTVGTSSNFNGNLFLINPNGIIFGRNASLNVGGSFVATTANAIGFGNQGFFSANNPNIPPLLTVIPSALLFNQITVAPIQNNSYEPAGLAPTGVDSFGLRVPNGRSLLLVSGDISMDSGELNAFGGRVELGGLARAGTVGLNVDDKELSLSFPDAVQRADVYLFNNSWIDVRASGGGSIAINAQNLEISGDSNLFAGIGEGLGTTSSNAGDITLNATKEIRIRQSSIIANDVDPSATGNSGNLIITTGSLFVTDGAELGASTYGQGNAGRVTINASNSVSFDGVNRNGRPSAAYSTVEPTGKGNTGGINIDTESLSVKNGALLTSRILGEAKNVGNININARDTVSIAGENSKGRFSAVSSRVEEGGVKGGGGDINIATASLFVTEGAFITATTNGKGDAGNVTINARDRVSFDGVGINAVPSGAYSRVLRNAEGQGGNVTVNVTKGSLEVTNGAQLSASTFARKDGGNIILNANTLEAVNGGQILTTSLSGGKAGNITANITESVTLVGSDPTYFERSERNRADGNDFSGAGSASGLFANTAETSTNNGGDLTITTGQLNVRDGAEITVSSEGTGSAGNMTVNARSIRLNNNALLSANTQSTKVVPNREQATININSQDLIMSRNSNITTNAIGENVIGGNINIDTDFLIGFENSDISANSANFRGGNVRINATGIFGTQFRNATTPNSDITATGGSPELSGIVEINQPDVDLSRGLINLPTIPVDTEVAQGCNSPNYAQSSFIITGRGGLPPNPKDVLTPDAVELDWVTLNPNIDNLKSPSVSTLTNSTPEPIVEATGWVFNAKGEVVFTADAPTTTPHGSWHNPVSCPAS